MPSYLPRADSLSPSICPICVLKSPQISPIGTATQQAGQHPSNSLPASPDMPKGTADLPAACRFPLPISLCDLNSKIVPNFLNGNPHPTHWSAAFQPRLASPKPIVYRPTVHKLPLPITLCDLNWQIRPNRPNWNCQLVNWLAALQPHLTVPKEPAYVPPSCTFPQVRCCIVCTD